MLTSDFHFDDFVLLGCGENFIDINLKRVKSKPQRRVLVASTSAVVAETMEGEPNENKRN